MRLCMNCSEFKPNDNFDVISVNKSKKYYGNVCDDCSNNIQLKMYYPILKQPSREWVLNQLKLLKKEEINKVTNPNHEKYNRPGIDFI